MSMGFEQSAVAPGTHFSQWDVASKRRYNASQGAPRPSWDVPAEGTPHPASAPQDTAFGHSINGPAPAAAPANGNSSWGNIGSAADPGSGLDPTLLAYRNSAMQDATARASGSRLSAMDASPNDPSLAGYAQLEGQLGGQDQAAHDVNAYSANLLNEQWQQQAQRQMAAYQNQLAEQYQTDAHKGDLMGGLGSILGGVAGSWLSPGGLFKGAGAAKAGASGLQYPGGDPYKNIFNS